jgi:phage shock protein E
MMSMIKDLLGFGPKVDLGDLISKGATIIDVRTKGEYAGGHVKGSLNIPLDQLQNRISTFKDKDKAIITCCASGARSSSAKSILKNAGFTNVHNGGPWVHLNQHFFHK